MSCNHSRRTETPTGYHCDKCGKDVKPQASNPVLHGTSGGYGKHRNYRGKSPEWGWPPCSPCAAAEREYDKAKRKRPEVRSEEKNRSLARARAHQRLQNRYQSEYARMYAQELSVLRDNGKSARADLEQQIEQTLRAVRCTEPALLKRCSAGDASPGEREVMRRVLALNRELIDLEYRCEQEKSRRAGK